MRIRHKRYNIIDTWKALGIPSIPFRQFTKEGDFSIDEVEKVEPHELSDFFFDIPIPEELTKSKDFWVRFFQRSEKEWYKPEDFTAYSWEDAVEYEVAEG